MTDVTALAGRAEPIELRLHRCGANRSAPGVIVPGHRVRHALLGEGKVLAIQGSGPTALMTVRFAGDGPKVVVSRSVSPEY